MALYQKKFSDEIEKEIAIEYIESGATMAQLAQKYECSTRTIFRIVHDSQILERMLSRAQSRTKIAQIKLMNESANASDKLIKLSKKERDDNMVYADIQLIQQILDRAGVRATKNEDNTLTLRFADGAGFELGETEEAQIEKEDV